MVIGDVLVGCISEHAAHEDLGVESNELRCGDDIESVGRSGGDLRGDGQFLDERDICEYLGCTSVGIDVDLGQVSGCGVRDDITLGLDRCLFDCFLNLLSCLLHEIDVGGGLSLEVAHSAHCDQSIHRVHTVEGTILREFDDGHSGIFSSILVELDEPLISHDDTDIVRIEGCDVGGLHRDALHLRRGGIEGGVELGCSDISITHVGETALDTENICNIETGAESGHDSVGAPEVGGERVRDAADGVVPVEVVHGGGLAVYELLDKSDVVGIDDPVVVSVREGVRVPVPNGLAVDDVVDSIDIFAVEVVILVRIPKHPQFATEGIGIPVVILPIVVIHNEHGSDTGDN